MYKTNGVHANQDTKCTLSDKKLFLLGMTDKFDVPLSDADEPSCRNCNEKK